MAPTNVSSLTDPAVQISRSGFFKRNSLLHPWVADPREQQRVSAEEGMIVIPRQPRPTRSSIEPVVPEPTGATIELPKTLEVRRAPVVLVVAPELGIEDLLLLVHRRMTMLLAPSTDRRQASAEPFVHRPYMHCGPRKLMKVLSVTTLLSAQRPRLSTLITSTGYINWANLG